MVADRGGRGAAGLADRRLALDAARGASDPADSRRRARAAGDRPHPGRRRLGRPVALGPAAGQGRAVLHLRRPRQGPGAGRRGGPAHRGRGGVRHGPPRHHGGLPHGLRRPAEITPLRAGAGRGDRDRRPSHRRGADGGRGRGRDRYRPGGGEGRADQRPAEPGPLPPGSRRWRRRRGRGPRRPLRSRLRQHPRRAARHPRPGYPRSPETRRHGDPLRLVAGPGAERARRLPVPRLRHGSPPRHRRLDDPGVAAPGTVRLR
jgi:hypothetical protein